MPSLVKVFPILFLLVLLQFPIAQAGKYKSILDFIYYRAQTTTTARMMTVIPSATFSISIPPSPTATPTAITTAPNIALTLLEKILVAIFSAVATSITGFVCVCGFKCYRNDGRLKVSELK